MQPDIIHNTPTTSGADRVRRGLAFTAGIAATLAAGVVFAAVGADAAPEADESTFVPITPCRLFDTRPGSDNVGDRNTPIGPGETHTVQVTGANGDCLIPADATAIALNATAVGATIGSYGTFHPSDAPRPLSSNLNYFPGQPPTPNKVDVKLAADGSVDVYNAFGQVDMLADVMGYYRASGLTDLQMQLNELRGTKPVAYQVVSQFDDDLTGDERAVLTLSGVAPAAGTVAAQYAATVYLNAAGADVNCGLAPDDTIDDRFEQQWDSPGPDGSPSTMSGTRVFDVAPGSFEINLVCSSSGNAAIDDHVITGTFIAD